MGEGDREERRGRYLTQAGRDLGGFVPPAFRQLVGMAEDQFKVWRAKRQVRLREQFQEFLFDRGLDAPTRSIAPAFMLPLIERASLEADDALQDVWAMLLANAADADCSTEMRMAFISMLSEMTSLDVVIMSKLDSAVPPIDAPHNLQTWNLPEKVGGDGETREPTGNIALSLMNLVRLGCILPSVAYGGPLSLAVVTTTSLGRAFLAACTSARAQGIKS
jgi:hypothetical protein